MKIHSKYRLAVYATEILTNLIAYMLLFSLVGCGSGSNSATSTVEPPTSAPVIVGQPKDASVPMGLSASYLVLANGYPLNFQWSKNGVPISGANIAGYTTPATRFSDSGSVFTLTVSNSLGSVTSNPATLTVTARAPIGGDLRFQQVDAASTVNGYGNESGLGSAILGRTQTYFGSSIGTPLYMSPVICGQPPISVGEFCEWPFVQFNLPGNLEVLGLSINYGADYFTNFEADLQSSTFPAGGLPINSNNSVVTSLDLEPPSDLFAASWIQSSQSSGFDMEQESVSLANLQAAATQEGLHSRVITAVAYNNGQVVYLSYGWQSDKTTIYETQVETATIATAESVAANLAAQGYIITALGGSNLNDSYLLVGTRVQGDTMPRPFMADGPYVYTQDIYTEGYALVGVLQDSAGNTTFLGER